MEGHTRSVSTLRYSLDGKWLVSGAEDGEVLVQATDGSSTRRFRGAPVITVAFASDSSLLAIATEDRFVRVYALADLRLLSEHMSYVRRMTFSRRGRTLVAACHDAIVRVWDLDAGRAIAFTTGTEPPIGVAASPTGDRVAFTTPHSFTAVDVDHAAGVRTNRPISTLVSAHVHVFQRPRAMTPEEGMLNYAQE